MRQRLALLSSVGNTVQADDIALFLGYLSAQPCITGYDSDYWELYAEVIPTVGGVDGSNGVLEVRALIDNIDFGTDGDAVTFASGIGATDPVVTSEGLRAPVLQTAGGTLDILYSQDTSNGPSVVGGIGTSGWTLIASDTFASNLILPTGATTIWVQQATAYFSTPLPLASSVTHWNRTKRSWKSPRSYSGILTEMPQ